MGRKLNTKIGGAGLALALVGYASCSGAAGFALIEQSGSGMGNAFAGAAATAEDASTIFFNPAGMSFLSGPQVVVAGHGIDLSAKFKNGNSTLPAAVPALPRGGDGGEAGGTAFVPNLYASLPIGERITIGIGVNAPFGLKTEYDDTWIGRYQGIKSDLTTVNVNPSIAWKITDAISIGGGVNYQRADAELTNAVVLGANTEGRAKLEADDDAWGWNLGAMFQLGSDMRIGVSYRSKMRYTLDGTVTVTTPTGAVVAGSSGASTAAITFPDMGSVSVMQKFGDKWDLLGDITFTRWSEIGAVDVMNSTNGTQRDKLVFNFDDAWRVSFGLNYHLTEKWTFKGGIAWDQSPVSDQFRTVRLPDADRYWLSLGAKFRMSSNLAFDVGYSHLFIQNATINNSRTQFGGNPATTTSTVNGEYEASVNILSLQLAYTF